MERAAAKGNRAAFAQRTAGAGRLGGIHLEDTAIDACPAGVGVHAGEGERLGAGLGQANLGGSAVLDDTSEDKVEVAGGRIIVDGQRCSAGASGTVGDALAGRGAGGGQAAKCLIKSI